MIPRRHLHCKTLPPSADGLGRGKTVDSGPWTVDSPKPRADCAVTLSRSHAFTLTELLVVMAIIAILSASLGIILSKVRTSAMVRRAKSDIQAIANSLEMYKKDIGVYPTAAWSSGYTPVTGFAEMVLYTALTDKDAGATRDGAKPPNVTGNANRGWGGASDQWDFITDNSRNAAHFLDPWGLPYYYISHGDYLRAVAIRDTNEDPGGTSSWPKVYGTTPAINDYSTTDRTQPPKEYYGPAPNLDAFYNPTTFQLHSKGPDQKTDIDDKDLVNIDPCDRGTDKDDINNFGGR